GTGMTARAGLIALTCHVIGVLAACPGEPSGIAGEGLRRVGRSRPQTREAHAVASRRGGRAGLGRPPARPASGGGPRRAHPSRASDGAFDVTVGPVVQLWRLARRTQQLPDPKELAAARAKVGWQKVRLDPKKRTVQLLTPGMQLDLGGIAKGFAADEALKLLRETFGVTRALVAASGDITCGDPPPGADAWAVDVAPIAKGQKPRALRLANAAV